MGESSNSAYDKNGTSSSNSGRVAVKRKAPTAKQSNQVNIADGKSIFLKENWAGNSQKEMGHFEFQKKALGRLDTRYKPALRSKGKEGLSQSGSKHGESRKLGAVLQRKNSPNRRRNNQVDQVGPNGDLGMVRLGVDAGLEEHVSVDGGEQRAGVPAVVELGMGVDAESVVEVCEGQASNATPSTSKLNLVKEKFRGANLGKIADRNRKGDDVIGDFREEDAHGQSSGMRYVGESEHGEDDPMCRDKDARHVPIQDVSGGEGYNPSLGNSIPRDADEQSRDDGGMEVENQ
nr:hypothetical protein CFP56_34470 [Quercus suber]